MFEPRFATCVNHATFTISTIMLQVNFIKNNLERVQASLQKRNFKNTDILEETIKLDELKRSTQTSMNEKQEAINKASKEIGGLFKQGKKEEAEGLRANVATLKEELNNLKVSFEEVSGKLTGLLYEIPNAAHASVPEGSTDEDNEVFQAWDANMPDLATSKLPHWELAKKYDLIDFELGAKITGAGFPVYKGKGAKLQRALINFFLDEADKSGYAEFLPPHMVNEASAIGTGQLPDKDGQMYHDAQDDLYLIPTAEVPITNIYRDVILKEEDFSIKMCGYTPCFRREAGSYGAHVRGLNRLHQFDKVEIVRIEHPERSYAALDEMLDHVRGLLAKLELPYRILRLCGGDLSFASALTFDFEVFSAAQERWLEVSSVSNFETFQSNRLKLRYNDANKKKHLAHTLNGSALALPRIVAALLENNQTGDGINIPKVLWKYTGFEKI